MSQSQATQDEFARRYSTSRLVVIIFFALTVVLLAITYFATAWIYRPRDPTLVNGLRIAVLILGIGAFVLRRTRFNTMRLKDIAGLRGTTGLLKTLQDTTIHVAAIGGAIALLGFVMTMITGDWTEMLRAAGVAVIVLIGAYPFRNAWQRAVQQLSPEE